MNEIIYQLSIISFSERKEELSTRSLRSPYKLEKDFTTKGNYRSVPLITKTPPQNKARWIQQCVIAGQDTVGFILGTELVWPEPSKWGLQADMSGLVKSTCEKLCQARAPWEGRTRLQTVRNEARTSSLVPATRPHAENPHCAIRQEEEAESKCTDWRGRNKAALIRQWQALPTQKIMKYQKTSSRN